MTAEVWKFQRPLNGPGGWIMAYPESREPTLLLAPEDDLLAMFGQEVKIYVLCEVVDGSLAIGRRMGKRRRFSW